MFFGVNRIRLRFVPLPILMNRIRPSRTCLRSDLVDNPRILAASSGVYSRLIIGIDRTFLGPFFVHVLTNGANSFRIQAGAVPLGLTKPTLHVFRQPEFEFCSHRTVLSVGWHSPRHGVICPIRRLRLAVNPWWVYRWPHA